MIYQDSGAWRWWESRRWRYNAGLVVAGILAFIAYAVLGSWLLADDQDFEITIFTVAFQGVGYLFMMAVANVCYLLGPYSERYVRPVNLPRYRASCFRLGFSFSFLLPFLVPVLVVISAIADHATRNAG